MTNWRRCAILHAVSQSEQKFIRGREAAEILGWSVAKVKRAARSGDLPTVAKLSGATGAYVFDRSVIEFVARQEAAA